MNKELIIGEIQPKSKRKYTKKNTSSPKIIGEIQPKPKRKYTKKITSSPINKIKSIPQIKEMTKRIDAKTNDVKTNDAKTNDAKTNINNFKENGISLLEKLDESKLVEMIQYANDQYYNSTSTLTDNEYDILKEYTEKKYPKNEILKEIGAPIQGKNKVTLPYEMASMDKIKPDTQALANWTKIYKGPYVLSCKLDGVSGLYICDQHENHKLYTRDNGIIAQDISHIIGALKLPSLEKGTAVRGEFIISKRVFKDKYADQFANARNLVSGIINKKTVDEKTQDLAFITYELIEPIMKPSEQMKTLDTIGKENGVSLGVVMNKKVATISNEYLSDLLLKLRQKYEYEIDGIIVCNDEIYPRVSGNPEHAFAFKMVMSDQVAEAKVVDVLWEASKDGYLKPRVRIEPIQLGGVRIEYATGFNGKFIEDNKIGIGALIMMVRSGDVIPYIKSVSTPAEKGKMPDVPYIWNKTHVDVLLENPTEDITVQEKNVGAFFAHLEIDGLGKGNVKKLFAAGFNSVPKILQMSVADFETVDGFKLKMSTKIYDSIKEKVEAASLQDIIAASGKLGRGLGEKKIRLIFDAYPDIMKRDENDFVKEEMLQKVNGIGKENAKEFVSHIGDVVIFLNECGLQDKLNEPIYHAEKNAEKDEKNEMMDTEHPLFGKMVVMTKVRDKEIIDFINKVGGRMENTMKKEVAVLIVKSKEDTSSKTEYAKKNNIPIMTIDEFKEKYM